MPTVISLPVPLTHNAAAVVLYHNNPSGLSVERSGDLVVETHAARRTVVLFGTAAQMNDAFGVTLGRYQRVTMRQHGNTGKM
jgi:hypothetical protein